MKQIKTIIIQIGKNYWDWEKLENDNVLEKSDIIHIGFSYHMEKKSLEFWKNTFSGSNTKIEFLYFWHHACIFTWCGDGVHIGVKYFLKYYFYIYTDG